MSPSHQPCDDPHFIDVDTEVQRGCATDRKWQSHNPKPGLCASTPLLITSQPLHTTSTVGRPGWTAVCKQLAKAVLQRIQETIRSVKGEGKAMLKEKLFFLPSWSRGSRLPQAAEGKEGAECSLNVHSPNCFSMTLSSHSREHAGPGLKCRPKPFSPDLKEALLVKISYCPESPWAEVCLIKHRITSSLWISDKQQILFQYKGVPCSIWDMLVWKHYSSFIWNSNRTGCPAFLFTKSGNSAWVLRSPIPSALLPNQIPTGRHPPKEAEWEGAFWERRPDAYSDLFL